jgi:hypothetical protein
LAVSSNPALESRSNSQPVAEPTRYLSNALRLFVQSLEKREETQLLDLGPVCGENVSFFARQVKRHYVCDMFLRLDRRRREGFPIDRVWADLDYPSQSFDGILVWDFGDRLEDDEVAKFVELCYSMIKPGGLAAVFVGSPWPFPSAVNAYVVGKEFWVHTRHQPHLDLPLLGRQNRDVLTMLAPFEPFKSFIYRSGLREFLFRRV